MAREGVFPVRRVVGAGWVSCASHQAQKWEAVVRGKTVGRYDTRALALNNMVLAKRQKDRVARSYRLGSRMPERVFGR